MFMLSRFVASRCRRNRRNRPVEHAQWLLMSSHTLPASLTQSVAPLYSRQSGPGGTTGVPDRPYPPSAKVAPVGCKLATMALQMKTVTIPAPVGCKLATTALTMKTVTIPAPVGCKLATMALQMKTVTIPAPVGCKLATTALQI